MFDGILGRLCGASNNGANISSNLSVPIHSLGIRARQGPKGPCTICNRSKGGGECHSMVGNLVVLLGVDIVSRMANIVMVLVCLWARTSLRG